MNAGKVTATTSTVANSERRIILALLLGLVFAVLGSSGLAASGQRVVAVGDLHGNIEALLAILQATGLIDGNHRWIGGEATLVQMGDILDRGARLREVLDLLMRLQNEAEAAGGHVVVLLGNHEILDLLGVIREVDPGAYVTFVDPLSEQRRQAAYQEFIRYLGRRASYLGAPQPQITEEITHRWFDAYPLGKVEYMAALLPDGRYGAWIRTWPTVVVLGDTIFVHGGLGPTMKGVAVEEINRRVAEEIELFDGARAAMAEVGLVQPTSSIHLLSQVAKVELESASLPRSTGESEQRRVGFADQLQPLAGWEQWLLAAEEGPLWNGAPTFWDEEQDADELTELLAGFGVERMVVAHIPRTDGKILTRFSGRLLIIDTWMEHYPAKGAAAALEIVGDTLTAVYLGEREVLVRDADSPAGPQP